MKDPTHGLFKIPSKEERIRARAGAPLNPLKLVTMLTPLQGALFFSGWLAWTMDAWDFFSVSLSVDGLLETFDIPSTKRAKITTAITLTLLFRSLGAAIFGIISDRYGRKWPLVINLLIISALELGGGFVQTYPQFLATRSLFGIGMGGIWGLATATALENMPAAPRGLFSGILQQGYAVGYLLAASVNLKWVPVSSHGWRVLFWLGAGLSLFAAIVRACLPESEVFLRLKRERDERGESSNKAKTFWLETKKMLKTHWLRCIYGVLLMTGFNFLSHSSQDLYPSIIKDTKGLSGELATKATIIGNCGAIAGGTLVGYLSQYLGRRLTIVAAVILTGALIPAWILPNTFGGLAAGAFFIQFGVQGAWGVVPIYLSEISPPAFRATFPGVAYQLGNMVSSASSQIEATGGDNLQITNPKYHGQEGVLPTIPDYATVSAILLGVVCGYLILVIVFGREYRGVEFENAPLAIERGAGQADGKDLVMGGKDREEEEDIEHVGDQVARDNSNSDIGEKDSKYQSGDANFRLDR